jgi:multidrug efflux pump subunit AcrB
MNLADWCIRNNRTAGVFFVLLTLAGILTFQTMSRLESPEFTVRVAVVSAYLPGAAPRKIEELITDKIEKKIQEMPEVKVLGSQSMTGLGLVEVELKSEYTDLQPIWTRLRNKMEDVKSELPSGVYGPYVNDEFGDVFPIVIALTGDGFTDRELRDYADDLRDELLAVPDVAKVVFYGAQAERVFVEFSNARLAELGLSPLQLADVLKNQNALQPGGRALVGPESLTLEITGEFRSIEDIRRTLLKVPGRPGTVYLGDVAQVRRGFEDPPAVMTRFNAAPCLMLAVSMAKGGRVTELGEAVRARLKAVEPRLPHGIAYEFFLYQPRFVERAIHEFTGNLVDSFLYVFLVILAFAGLRAGVVAAALVPMAMLACIALMPFFDIQLHAVSIASLIIALGMLVDNGVCTSENILVRLAAGQDRHEACAGAVRELAVPLLAASLTTIFAFLPIGVGKGDVAEYCRSLFQVIAITLLCSWVLSLSFTPLLSFYLLKPQPRVQRYEGPGYRLYRAFIIGSLKRRGLFLGILIALFAVSLWGFTRIPTIFFPPNEREMFMIDFWQPYGTDIRTTRDRVARLESFLLADTNVVHVGVFVGEGGPRWYLALNIEQENPNYANVIVNTRDIPCVKPLMKRVSDHLAANFPDCRFTVKELENGPPVGAPIQLRLSGKNLDTIYALRDRLAAAIARVPGVNNIRDDWGEWTKKLVVDINQEKAKQADLTSQDVAVSLLTQLSGFEATDYREGREVIPILLRSQAAYRESLGHIESLNLYAYGSPRGVPLRQVATTALEWQPSNIRHRNKIRTMTLKADVQGRFASEAMADIVAAVDDLVGKPDWPAGYAVEYAGEDKESADAQNMIYKELPLAIGLLVLVLIWQFNSLRRPLIIMLTIPPVLIGVTPGLLLTGSPFGFMAFLGLVSLMGIVVNNAILLIDRMELEKAAGQTLQDAIVLATQRRLRPILMTAITTIIGLVPLAVGAGEMWRPMANTIMFGLAVATVLSLGLCPVLYSLFFPASFRDYVWNPQCLDKSAAE